MKAEEKEQYRECIKTNKEIEQLDKEAGFSGKDAGCKVGYCCEALLDHITALERELAEAKKDNDSLYANWHDTAYECSQLQHDLARVKGCAKAVIEGIEYERSIRTSVSYKPPLNVNDLDKPIRNLQQALKEGE